MKYNIITKEHKEQLIAWYQSIWEQEKNDILAMEFESTKFFSPEQEKEIRLRTLEADRESYMMDFQKNLDNMPAAYYSILENLTRQERFDEEAFRNEVRNVSDANWLMIGFRNKEHQQIKEMMEQMTRENVALRNFDALNARYMEENYQELDYSFEEIVAQVHNYMRYYINEKFLCGDITTNAATTRNPFIRVVPLFVKDYVVRMFYMKVQDRNSSAGLTNMGALKVPEGMAPYIERFDIYMGQPFSNRTNCAIASFGDVLTINFASSIVETDVERYFFRKLVQDGIHVKIESNRGMPEIDG